jgi:hypothetical protein
MTRDHCNQRTTAVNRVSIEFAFSKKRNEINARVMGRLSVAVGNSGALILRLAWNQCRYHLLSLMNECE